MVWLTLTFKGDDYEDDILCAKEKKMLYRSVKIYDNH